jgi:hypothetical protein
MNLNTEHIITITDDWEDIYSFTDLQKAKMVRINIPPTSSINSSGSRTSTVPFSFILWQGPAYDTANSMNNGLGYGNADLINAITAYLANLSTTQTQS